MAGVFMWRSLRHSTVERCRANHVIFMRFEQVAISEAELYRCMHGVDCVGHDAATVWTTRLHEATMQVPQGTSVVDSSL